MRFLIPLLFLFIHACGCTGLAQTYIEKQASGPFNLLMNPGFENGKAKWTFGTGCGIGSVAFSGVSSLACSGINTARTLNEQSITVSDHRPYISRMFKASCQGAANVTDNVQVCGLFNGAETSCVNVKSNEVSLNAEGYKEYAVAVPIPSTQSSSFTVGVKAKTIGTTTTAANIDQCYVGPWEGVVGLALNTTKWTDYVPSTSGLGSSVINFARWRQVGSNMEIDLNITAGTTTGVAATVSLPSGYTAANPVAQNYGTWRQSGTSTDNFTSGSFIVSPGATFISFTDDYTTTASSGSPASTPTASTIIRNGAILYIQASIPINGLEANTVTNVVGLVQSEDVFSADISSTGAITNETGGDWLSSCTNATTPVCTFTANWFGGIAPHCWHDTETGQFLGSSLTTTTTYAGRLYTGGGSDATGSRRYFCRRVGTDYTNARKTFDNVPLGNIATPGGGPTELIARARINCAASSSVIFQKGNWISAISNISSGQCNITMSGFSSEPNCFISYNGGFTTAVVVSGEVTSATNYSIDCATSPSSACGAYVANILCIGTKQ